MNIFWTFGEFVMTCIDVAYFLLIPLHQIGCKRWVNINHLLFYALFCITTITGYNYFTANSISIIFLSIALFLLYSYLFLKADWLRKVFWLIFPFALLYSSELTAGYAVTHLYPQITLVSFESPSIYRLQMILSSRIIEISLLTFLLHFKLKLENSNYVISAIAIVSSFTMFFSLFGHLLGFTGLDTYIAQSILFQFASAFLLTNFSYFLYLIFISYKAKKYQVSLQYQLAAQQQEINQTLAHQLALQQNCLQQIRDQELTATHHSFKYIQIKVRSIFHTLRRLAKEHQIPQLEKQLAESCQNSYQFRTLYRTGNAVLDAVLSNKEALAHSQNVQLKASVNLPPANQFDSFDLSIILIHLLDNAMKALQKLVPIADYSNQIIELIMCMNNNCYKIEIKNRCSQQEYCPYNQLTTLSSNHTAGLSLKIIEGLVHKYHGTLQIIDNDNVFTIVILLPLNQT